MFQKFNGEHDQHPDILDRAAFARPQAKSWNWRLTILICFLSVVSAFFLTAAYGQLRSDAVNSVEQILMTWLGGGIGFIVLMSVFLLYRRSPLGWLMTTILVSLMLGLFLVVFGKFLFTLSQSFISVSELPTVLWLELGFIPLGCFMLFLLSHKAVRQIFRTPLQSFWVCLALGGFLGGVAGGWVVF
ncbi:MAG: hypothetical protein AB8H12_05365 [Lewinella sp.]